MTDNLVLTEFVPGTKAKAQEVNANFSALKDAVNTKVAIGGDRTQTFNVAAATEGTHAVNKSQLDTVSAEITKQINTTSARFCAKSGNTTSGKGDLFTYSSLAITSKVGGSYPNLVISDYKGTFTVISSVATLSMTGKTDGIYNLFIAAEGILYALKNTIYKQADRPTMVDGDVWLNTSVEPIKAVKYNGTTDEEFLGVPLGKVTIASSAITAIETYPFNQNGYDVNIQTYENNEGFARKIIGNRVWISGEYQPIKGTQTTVTHNLNIIDTKKVHYDVVLLCKVANNGYIVGDYANWGQDTGYGDGACQCNITTNTISQTTGASGNGIRIENKSTGGSYAPDLSQWVYVFRIWY